MVDTYLMQSLPPTGWSFRLNVSDEVAGERGTQVRVKQLGPDLWTARYESNQMRPKTVRVLRAAIQAYMAQRTTFYGWDPGGQFPQADPDGSKLTAPGSVQINSLNADNIRMSLRGLPNGYQITYGDYLAFDYYGPGLVPVRAFHQIVAPAYTFANAGGVTPEFYVIPRIRIGASVTAPAILIRASAEMMVLPGSFAVEEGPQTGSIMFEALQVLA